MAAIEIKNAVYGIDHYHTWNGYNWLSFKDIAGRYNAFPNKELDERQKGRKQAWNAVQKMIGTIEALPFSISAYHAFALLAAWCYLRYEELNHVDNPNDYHNAMQDVFESGYCVMMNDYAPDESMIDVYSYLTRISEDRSKWALIGPSQQQLMEIVTLVSVKKPRGKKLYRNTDIGVPVFRVMLGAMACQLLTSPYDKAEKQARLHALNLVLHKVFA